MGKGGGNPILRPEPDPLPPRRGFFCPHATANEVGSQPAECFVAHQHELAEAFVPLVSVDGGSLLPAWAGQRLRWVYGGLNEGGVYFRVLCGQLEYMGTARHPSPDWTAFPDDDSGDAAEWPVSPGYVEYVAADDDDEESVDSQGYRDAPAVRVGGEPPRLPAHAHPACLCCRGGMHYIGEVETDMFSDDLQETRLLLFYCHDCRLQCCLDAPQL